MNEIKFCECGCGLPAPIARRTRSEKGHVKGQPIRFINGHVSRGSLSCWWRGGRRVNDGGYVRVRIPDYSSPRTAKTVAEHILLVQSILGRELPPSAEVHHVNKDRADNRNKNLVACQDHAYHMLLHRRVDALAACGNPSWMKCDRCKRHDDPAVMYLRRDGTQARHRTCAAAYQKKRRELAKRGVDPRAA